MPSECDVLSLHMLRRLGPGSWKNNRSSVSVSTGYPCWPGRLGALAQLTEAELALARHHLLACAERLARNEGPTKHYARAFRRAR